MEANIYLHFFREDKSAERKSIDEIVGSLSIKPNEIDRQNEKMRNRPSKTYEQDCLSYYIKRIQCSFIDEEIDDFINSVMNIKTTLDKEMPNYTSSFSVAVYADGQSNPEVIISPTTLANLSSLNAKIWIDIYCTSDSNGKWDNEEKMSDKLRRWMSMICQWFARS